MPYYAIQIFLYHLTYTTRYTFSTTVLYEPNHHHFYSTLPLPIPFELARPARHLNTPQSLSRPSPALTKARDSFYTLAISKPLAALPGFPRPAVSAQYFSSSLLTQLWHF